MLELNCDRCGQTLNQPGALAFSPPDHDGWRVDKYHLCVDCWSQLAKQFQRPAGDPSEEKRS